MTAQKLTTTSNNTGTLLSYLQHNPLNSIFSTNAKQTLFLLPLQEG